MTDQNQPQYPAPQGQPVYGQQDQPQYGQPQYGQQAQPQGQYGAPQYGAPQYGSEPGRYAPAAVTRPPAMDKAVMLMKAGAVVAILNALTAFLMRDTIRDAAEKSMRDANTSYTPDTLNAAVNISMGFALFFGLVGALLWWWMAMANGKGRSWARLTATIFFVISCLSFIYSFTQPSGGAIALILSVVEFLIGAAAIFFMYQKESSRFYEASSRKF